MYTVLNRAMTKNCCQLVICHIFHLVNGDELERKPPNPIFSAVMPSESWKMTTKAFLTVLRQPRGLGEYWVDSANKSPLSGPGLLLPHRRNSFHYARRRGQKPSQWRARGHARIKHVKKSNNALYTFQTRFSKLEPIAHVTSLLYTKSVRLQCVQINIWWGIGPGSCGICIIILPICKYYRWYLL